MKSILMFSLGVFTISCVNTESQKTVQLVTSTTNQTFEQYFELVDSFGILSKIVEMPIHISILKDKLVICDYEKDEVSVLRNNGEFLFKIKDEQKGAVKKLQKPICTYVTGDSIFIASNHGRRILLYKIENGSIAKYLNSFIIFGSNITPIDMNGFDNKLIMAGFNMYTNNLLHIYDVNGKYLNSFMKTSDIEKEKKEGVIQSALNYPFLDFMNGNIYAIEHIIYRISKFNKEGKEIIKKEIQPDYAIRPDKNSLNPSETAYMKTNNLYSWPIQLKAYKEKIFTQMIMPGPSVFNSPQEYFSKSKYRLDIFDTNCQPVAVGINCESHNLQALDKENGLFYFITGYDFKRQSFMVKSYKIKNL